MAISARPYENEYRIGIVEEMLIRDGVAGVTLEPLRSEGPGDTSNGSLTMKLHTAPGADKQRVEAAWARNPPTVRVRDYAREREIDNDMGDPPSPQYSESRIPTEIVSTEVLPPGERHNVRPSSERYIDPDGLLGEGR
ncbi:hypothetical protein GCM10023169_08140 [Georgenia halophila]|uniref:Uncharacterized protein n=1 Tax=Georgenia halophila TaxID=620889 RepID=A0ABP8KY44_9MICO